LTEKQKMFSGLFLACLVNNVSRFFFKCYTLTLWCMTKGLCQTATSSIVQTKLYSVLLNAQYGNIFDVQTQICLECPLF